MNIFIEGNIGAGKSTLINILGEKFGDKCVTATEPVNEWTGLKNENGETLLELYYADLKRYSYLFQSVVLRTRVQTFNKCLSSGNHNLGFFERSIYADRYCFADNCYKSGLMNNIEFTDYNEWFDWIESTFQLSNKISGFIYLKTDPNVSLRRINNRHREAESQIPLDYLIMLNEKHDRLISNLKETHPILILDGNLDFKNDANIKNDFMEKIKIFVEETSKKINYSFN